MDAEKPLFIPLKGEFFDAFERGDKTTEYRPYGKRWNEVVCRIGRPVVLSRGYGKQRRMVGRITGFGTSWKVTQGADWQACYGNADLLAACIGIEVDRYATPKCVDE
jgi:hypothetical protein